VDAYGLEALGDPTRRAILERLLGGPLPVGEIASGLPVSRPAVPQDAQVLRHCRPRDGEVSSDLGDRERPASEPLENRSAHRASQRIETVSPHLR